MKCPEIRNEIEKIENLRKQDHTVPPGVASHFKDCTNCEKYHKASQALEIQLFNKIKDIAFDMGIPENTLKTKLSRLRKKIKENIE